MSANELSDMNVNKLADDLERASSDMEYNIHVSDWALLFESAVVLRQQKNRIDVLEVNHKIQLDIAKKQSAYIAELEKANVYAVNKLKECVDERENNRHDTGISEAIGFEKGYQVGLRKAQDGH